MSVNARTGDDLCTARKSPPLEIQALLYEVRLEIRTIRGVREVRVTALTRAPADRQR